MTIDGVVLGHRCKSCETAGCEPRSLHAESPAFHCRYTHTKHQVELPPLTAIYTTIKTTSVCDGDARSVGGGSGWLAADTDGLAGDG